MCGERVLRITLGQASLNSAGLARSLETQAGVGVVWGPAGVLCCRVGAAFPSSWDWGGWDLSLGSPGLQLVT